MSARQRAAAAQEVAKQLPSGFRFDSMRRFNLGGSEHEVALFDLAEARFALLPGGAVSIGFDAEREWEPLPDELASWQQTAEQCGISRPLHVYIRDVTQRRRQV
jgi:hypothetical protein